MTINHQVKLFKHCHTEKKMLSEHHSGRLRFTQVPWMYNVGSLAINKQRFASSYDTRPYVALAQEITGITGAG